MVGRSGGSCDDASPLRLALELSVSFAIENAEPELRSAGREAHATRAQAACARVQPSPS